MRKSEQTRRKILKGIALTALAGSVCNVHSAVVLTPSQAEGPFYPIPDDRLYDQDNDLVKLEKETRQAGGEIFHLSGVVMDSSGVPVPGAQVEIWQCDVNGRYIHPRDGASGKKDRYFQGFGKTVTQAAGEYYFRTIKPVPYTGRTPHIHFKVFAPQGQELLTTQMYLAGEPLNDFDGLYRRIHDSERAGVTVTLQAMDDTAVLGRFDIVLGV